MVVVSKTLLARLDKIKQTEAPLQPIDTSALAEALGQTGVR
jgi:hypothetical protein